MSNTIATRDNTQSMRPANISEAMKLSDILCKSSMIPKEYRNKPGDVLAALIMGNELGLAPMQAMQGICVINGRPSLYGDTVLGLCMRHPSFSDCAEHQDNGTATCTIARRDREKVTRTFSEEDAKKAGLWGKSGPWSQYPKRMLQLRARSFALRDAFPDVLKGISVAEEQRDIDKTTEPSLDTISEPASRIDSVLSRLEAREGPKPPPRYDAVFEAGTAALDDLAGPTGHLVSPLNAYMLEIGGASSVSELQEVAARYSHEFTEDEKEQARKAYRDRRMDLFEPIPVYDEKLRNASDTTQLMELALEIEEKVAPSMRKDVLLARCRERISVARVSEAQP